MRLIVIVPTLGRNSVVNRLLAHLERQHRLPEEVLISAPEESHLEPYAPSGFRISYVFGKMGSSAQRNQALEHALDRSDIITFLDDDFLPADDYFKLLSAAFEQHPDWAVIMGHVVRDGARCSGFSFDEGFAALRAAEANRPTEAEVVDHPGAYGCNMSMRSRDIGDLRFDERLVLYGWQEDIDFTSQVGRHGRIVSVNTIIGIHLGVKTGRVSGARFGYSQIVNPIYLIRKGTIPIMFALRLMARNLAANLLRSVRPEAYIDRRGRLKGNLLGLYHVIRGRIEPEYILKL